MRHSVGAEKGRGATALAGLLQLRTSWDSRSQALSGRASKIAMLGYVVPIGEGVVCCDISYRFLKLKTVRLSRLLALQNRPFKLGKRVENAPLCAERVVDAGLKYPAYCW